MEAKAAAIIQKRYREHAATKYNLTEKQKEFIRPWYKRWRTKSIFQVLLLYRADRLQTIVNFCLQIHIYNQNFINYIQKTIAGVNLDEINLEATPKEYLPPSKPTIPKLLFMWESLNLRGDVGKCDKLPDCDVVQLESEILSKLIKKKITASEEIAEQNPKIFEDKEIQACLNDDGPFSTNKEQPKIDSNKTLSEEEKNMKIPSKKEFENNATQKKDEFHSHLEELNESVPKIDQNALLNITMIKTALDNLRQNDHDLPSRDGYEDNFQETRIQALRSRPPSKKTPKAEIKTNPEQRLRNSINEMEEKFRNVNYDENGDNPPFNFKAMLKKTNYTREVQKPTEESVAFRNEINNLLEKRRKSFSCGKFDKIHHHQSDTVSIELAPGILIHGKIADL